MALVTYGLHVGTRVRPHPGRSAGARRPVAPVAAPVTGPPVAACAPLRTRQRPSALLAAALVAALVAACLLLLRSAATEPDVPSGIAVAEVHSGESLWDLARRVAPDSRPEAVVARIRQLNGMSGSTVHPGQPLLVPDDG